MSDNPLTMAFFNYIEEGRPFEAQWKEWQLRLSPMEVEEALRYARKGLEGVLSVPLDKKPGPAWRIRWDIMPNPDRAGSFWFTAYTSYSLAPDFPDGFAYIHLSCVGSRTESGEVRLSVFVKDDLGWIYPYPEKAANRAIDGIEEYLRNWRLVIE
jgi:hypothetical protein